MIVRGNNRIYRLLGLIRAKRITSDQAYKVWRSEILKLGLQRIKPARKGD